MSYVPGAVGGVGGGLELGAKRSNWCFSAQRNINAVMAKCGQQREKNTFQFTVNLPGVVDLSVVVDLRAVVGSITMGFKPDLNQF